MRWAAVGALAVLTGAGSSRAAEEGSVHFAAHATQGYLRAEGFRFDQLGLDEHGSAKWTLYALRAEMRAAEGVRLMSELAGERIGSTITGQEAGDSSALAPHFSVAAGEYAFRRWAILRGGIQRIPLGLYNEYRYVGIAYESTVLPSMYLHNIGFIAESFRGLSLSGSAAIGDRGLHWIGWAGEFEISQYFTSRYGKPRLVRNAVGGKVEWLDWIDGLEWGATAYAGQDFEFDRAASSDLETEPRQQVDAWTVFARYQSDWGIGARFEYAESNGLSAAYYGQATYQAASWLRFFVLYDRFNTFRYQAERNYHDAWHFGVNWIPVSAWVIKAEWQRITGNLLDNNQPDPKEVDGAFYGSVSYSYF